MKRTVRIFLILLRSFFSFAIIKSLLNSIGYYIYDHVLWRLYIKKKKGVFIHPKASIRNAYNIILGYNSRININCCVWAGVDSKIIIGNNLLMGPNCSIQGVNHGTKSNELINKQTRKSKGNIEIGDDCWLGSNVTITSGVKIANGIIVGANSVVTKDLLEENSIYAGVPAKYLKKREDQ